MPLATLVLVLALMAWQPSSVSVSVPAFPTAPVVVDNRNGTVTIIGTGDSY